MMLDLKTDRSEKVKYDFSDYFAYVRKGYLSEYPDYCALSHWHDDIELISVLSGGMEYNVNGKVIKLGKGDGLFVNARQLHFGFSAEKHECEFICVLLHPLLLCLTPEIEQTYITPVLNNETFAFLLLKSENPTEKRILKHINRLYFNLDQTAPQLSIQSGFCQIWIDLYKLLPKNRQLSNNFALLTSVKNMIRLIQDRYAQRLSLDDIATAGSVCKSKCCALFRQYLNQTPFEYLTRYRLLKSVEKLRTNEMNLTEICYSCGFSGVSYFAETFRKYYGCSPSVYRKKG